MSDDILRQKFDRAIERAKHRRQKQAVLGKGDADKTLHVSDRTGYVWARLQYPGDSTPFQVRAQRITPAYGAPVLVEKAHDGVWEVIGSDGTAIFQYAAGSGYAADSPNHAVTHQRFGSDPIQVSALQMQPLLTRPMTTPGLSVYVEPAKYFDPGGSEQSWDGGTIDLTSKVPSTTGHQVIIVVGLDTDTGTLTTADGTSSFQATSNLIYVPFSRADVASISLPANFEPSAAVRLYTGQTRIDLWDIFVDWRNWFGGGGSTPVGLSLQPTVIDQDYTIPANYQAAWVFGYTITTGSLTVLGDEYIINEQTP